MFALPTQCYMWWLGHVRRMEGQIDHQRHPVWQACHTGERAGNIDPAGKETGTEDHSDLKNDPEGMHPEE